MWVEFLQGILASSLRYISLKHCSFPRLSLALQHVITIVDKVHGDQLHTNELQDTIDKLGLHLTEEKIQDILQDIDVGGKFFKKIR